MRKDASADSKRAIARSASDGGSSLALLAMTSEGSVSVLAAAHRRHRHLIAPAASAIDLVAGAELQILSQTDAHFA